MNAPLTDKQRITFLEMRVGELEREVAMLRGERPHESQDEARAHMIAPLRHALASKRKEAGTPAAISVLLLLLDRPGTFRTRRALYGCSRSSRSWTGNPLTNSVNVRLSHLRAALADLGFPDAIRHDPAAGWTIMPPDAERIKATLLGCVNSMAGV